MNNFASIALQGGAVLSAGIAGSLVGSYALQRKVRIQQRQAQAKRLQQAAQGETTARDMPRRQAWFAQFRALRYAQRLTMELALGTSVSLADKLPLAFVHKWFEARVKQTGALSTELSAQGFTEASLRLALFCAAIAAALGAVFSNELMLLGALIGAVFGASSVARDLKAVIKLRSQELSKHLPEMLEVVALGLRSGLSFDRSLNLYAQHFNSTLAFEYERALQKWMMGLATREVALREVAESYDSVLLTRVTESIVRSLRFGSSLAEPLEQAAAEARLDHRSLVEERVAKAPVKMMIPTGTLILPAMLLLVLGPVLLELIGGF